MEKVVWVLTMIFRALCKILCVAYVIFSVFVGFLYYYYFFCQNTLGGRLGLLNAQGPRDCHGQDAC